MRNRSSFVLVGCVALFAGWPPAALAQESTREVALDVRPWSADVSMAWERSPGHLWGVLVGGGPDGFNRTFMPEVDAASSDSVTLEQIVRIGPFYRYESGARFSVDAGLRVALGGVRGTSGAMSAVGGLQTALFFGGSRVRLGPRLFIGKSTESGVDTIVHVDWLTARIRFPF